MALHVRSAKRQSGSGVRLAGQIAALERRCTALEKEVHLLALNSKLEKALARIADLEAKL